MKYHISRRADADIEEICDYIARDNLDAASRMDEQIQDAIRSLSNIPGIGHTRSDFTDLRYRFWVVGRYVIAYRIERDTLLVVRVVHGARDFRALFPRR